MTDQQTEEILRSAYRAFNARDVDAALELMHAEVDWPNLGAGDRRQVLGPEQGDQGAAVDDGEAALAQLHVGAGEARHLGGEVGLVADEEDISAAGSQGR